MTSIDVVHVSEPDDEQLAAAQAVTGTDIALLRRRLAAPWRSLLLAADAGRVVGAALLTTRADAVLDLYPDAGSGGALIAAAVPALSDSSTVSSRAVVGSDAESALRAAGFRQDRSASLLECSLAELTAAELPAGYRSLLCVGVPPDDWLAGLVRVKQAVGELDAGSRPGEDVAELHRQYEVMARRGTVYSAVVESDREVAGFSDLVVPSVGGPASQAGTGVLPEHRGRRLSAALKAATARAVREHHPAVTSVHTTIDDGNAAMLAVSERLGFRTVQRTGSWTLTL